MYKKIQTLIILSFIVFHSLSVTVTLPTDNHTISPYGFIIEWID